MLSEDHRQVQMQLEHIRESYEKAQLLQEELNAEYKKLQVKDEQMCVQSAQSKQELREYKIKTDAQLKSKDEQIAEYKLSLDEIKADNKKLNEMVMQLVQNKQVKEQDDQDKFVRMGQELKNHELDKQMAAKQVQQLQATVGALQEKVEEYETLNQELQRSLDVLENVESEKRSL